MGKQRILLVGYGGAGKDIGLEYLAAVTGLANAGCTSAYLKKYVAKALGVSEAEAYAKRKEPRNRELWMRLGDELELQEPGKLLREALANGPLTGGVRRASEIEVARKYHLVDLIVWVENVRQRPDNGMTAAPEHCDILIQNNTTLPDYYEKLRRLAAFAELV